MSPAKQGPISVGPQDDWRKPKIFWFLELPFQLIRSVLACIRLRRNSAVVIGLLRIAIAILATVVAYIQLIQPQIGFFETITTILVSYLIGLFIANEGGGRLEGFIFEAEIAVNAIFLGIFWASILTLVLYYC